MSSVPFTRSLAYVLREQLQDEGARLAIGQVVSVPDSLRVQITIGGSTVSVPRLSSYVPIVGEAVYCLVAKTTILALGAVRAVGGGSWVAGAVNANGTIASGTGFSVVHAAPGNYDVTLDAPLTPAMCPIVTPWAQSVVCGATRLDLTRTFRVLLTTPGAWTDAGFFFAVFGVRG